ncbi:hypothetical protein H0I29_04065 [Polaribacter sp. R2A056_3_33]|uniref:sacsin N-terminal ATP-binding-like domain-containing protein n=1 Tax=Polaribacter sp. R2A056_3_33 TaxID=2745563 RepID=UPI001C4F50B9|nr:hypothetical protein [Polaribacter sp. R2A056_3_33]QXP71271.1 hypothetical protein H0I29_04065 [Polaribacter sp. R2A056_3_33]
MSIREEVDKIIRKRWSELRNPNNLISLNSIEKQTNQGYNGRQLLELFQNCEDEGATKVKIFLDTNKNLLEISNDGSKPFSVNGYASIFYPGLSAKVSSGYIGNKGLGFRSIVNWADKISIISNDFKLVFDTSLKKDVLLNEIGYCEEELTEIREDRKLKADVYPLPLLNCCKLEDVDPNLEFTTTISIRYNSDYEERIKEQLKSISEKTLLFLHNINTIEIDGNVLNKTISVTRKKITENNYEINYNGQVYYVISDDGVVDEDLIEDKDSSEPKRYSVKIAYNNDLTFKDKVLYNYFKTQIPFELPFVAHASLELDQNRNHSTESKVNPFILNKLFQLHLKLIDALKNTLTKSWLPYQSVNNEMFTVYKPYSDVIDNYWWNFEIYPILSGDYVKSSVAKNLGNRIANFIQKNNLENHFGEQLVYCDLPITPQQYVEKPKNYKELLEGIAVNLTIAQRAELVRLLLEIYPNEKFCVLIDEKDKPIKVEDFVFTNKTTENKDLKVPSYSNIRFLNPQLHTKLLEELDLRLQKNKSRSLKDELEGISNIQSFEPQYVIKSIITETITYLGENTDKKLAVIKEFYQKLFHNYKLRGDNPKLDYDAVIPCLNRENRLEKIQNLVLSDEFEIGKLSKEIFGELYDNKLTIANLENLGLETENAEEVEAFLKWLGVNPFSVIEKISTAIEPGFIQYSNNIHNTVIHSYSLFSIKNFNKILNKESININQVISWLSLDEKIKNIFTNYTLLHSNVEKLNYVYRKRIYQISDYQNLIFYKITQLFNIKDYLITSKKQEWFNPFKIDYEYLSKINKGLDKTEVDRILVFFGAKKDFNDLDINYLKKRTQELANKNNSKSSQVFYKSLVGHYKKNEQSILDVDLYAREGEKIVVKNANDIYFSDRIKLPEGLTKKFPIFYYPSRSGGSRAIKMFGLTNLNDLDLEIETENKNAEISQDFEKFIKEIKPFVLAFRLDKISKEDDKNKQVRLLNKLKINCSKELVCSIDKEVFQVEPYNYAYSNNQFYLHIPNGVSIVQLKQKKQFRDNLSDIFLKVFDTLDEKKTFESIIMQSKEDNIYDVRNELAEGILEDANILLGEISIRLSVWKTIFRLKGIDGISDLNEHNIEEYIYDNFPELSEVKLFSSDDNIDEIVKIRNVFTILDIDLKSYNDISDYKLSFDTLFNKELNLFYDERKKLVKNQLWQFLLTETIDEQKLFIKNVNKIEHLINGFSITQNENSYNLDAIIINALTNLFPKIDFELENEDYPEYDFIESSSSKHFSDDEILNIRRDEELNSLIYFEGHIDYIKSQLEENKEEEKVVDTINGNASFNLDINQVPEFIEEFEIITKNNGREEEAKNGFWLGGSGNSGLSDNDKKKLGNSVEEIIRKYLYERPHLYKNVELIARTNENEHYDIKYYDVLKNTLKFVESKYYNGTSFMLSNEEKKFGEENKDKYEIWLVNKDSKIFAIKNIKKLGELQPLKYKVQIKLKEYAIKD